MRLSRVSVRKYRSIDKVADFEVGDFTVLIGPNNQGKSNLLRAAVLAMEAIEGWAREARFLDGAAGISDVPLSVIFSGSARAFPRARGNRTVGYDWERDFPLFARDRKGGQRSTVIHLDFELDAAEQIAFRDATGLSINQRLPIEVSLNSRTVSLSIPKQGRGGHKEKAGAIAKFITERVSLLHIPAVRTGAIAMNIAEEILASRRRRLLHSPEYSELLRQLDEHDQQAIREVETMLQRTLTRFIPGTDRVELQVRPLSRAAGLEQINIDDGVSTPIATKGDGIQSLVALALTMEWTQSTSHPDRQLIVAVEEPESHLHPGAVHELRAVLHGIAESQQVIVTTHSQALVNRSVLSSNVIVSDRTAKPAKSLADLRTSLGVRLSDALAAAEVTVVVEGYLDEQVLPKVLVQAKPDIATWMNEGRILFESAGSGSKIYARALAARTILTNPVVVLDGDQAGRSDVARLMEDGVIDQTSVVQIVRPNCKLSELEDIFQLDSYIEAVETEIGFPLDPRQRSVLENGRDLAWSERLEKILHNVGVPNSAALVKRCKRVLATAVVAAIDDGNIVVRADCEALVTRLAALVEKSLHGR